ncbi:MAG TPA: MBL fold metallo-hydrolase [Acidimicrobiales bacterium]|nr:MBL fold metallo-hydrolase [Acidimicrobiales bacterium]
MTAGWLLEGPEPVLVETGSQTSVPVVLDALADLGLAAGDLAAIVVTHIHLDHAGGVGDLARAFPNAAVYVHPVGARHLVDPSRLVASAARVFGDTLDTLYGRLEPTPEERIRGLEDGEEIRVGAGRALTAVHSPGHAHHHLALHDSETGVLFTGDAAGVRLPDVGVLRPATPPPDFDLDLAVRSLRRFAYRRPSALALAHFGVLEGDPAEILDQAEDVLREWAAVAEAAWRRGDDVAAALAAAFGGDPSDTMSILNGVHSNAAGLTRWLETRATPPRTA